jgi:hypothetical protein
MAIRSTVVLTECRHIFWFFTSAAALDKDLVHSFSGFLWESDCHHLRSEIWGIDTRIARRWTLAACRCRHAPRLKHFRFPKAGAELCAELPAANFLSDPRRRCFDLYSTSLGMLHLLLCPPSRFIPPFLAEHPRRMTCTACLRGELHCRRGKTVVGRPNIAARP